jgi:hypothetical protein
METKKNTDKHYNLKKVEKLFLYCIGKSPYALSINKIENKVEKEYPGSRQNYVHEIEKKLHPNSEYIPSILLFTEDDFLTKQSGEYNLETKRFNDRISKVWKTFFEFNNENDLCEKTTPIQCTVKDRIKEIKVTDDKGNHIRLEVNFSNLIKNEKLNKDDIKIFTKSRLFENENEPYLEKSREKGRLVVRAYDIYFDIRSKYYVDIVSINSKIKYVLNLRGLLYFVSLCNNSNNKDINNIKKVIQNVSDQDEYIDLQEEIDLKFGTIITERIRDGKNYKVQKYPDSNIKNSIKKRFPFLTFYNKYKNCFDSNDEDFTIEFLFGIVKEFRKYEFKKQLERLSISELKYKVTKRYLQKMRNYFYEYHHSRLVHISIDDETFDAIINFQNEVGIYIKEVKKVEYEMEIKKRELFKHEEEKFEFQRKFNKITNSNENIISIKSILPVGKYGTINLNGSQLSIIERFCKYGRENNEKYTSINSYLLIKTSLLKDIDQKIGTTNFYDDLKLELENNRIPLDSIISIENWINDYRICTQNNNSSLYYQICRGIYNYISI